MMADIGRNMQFSIANTHHHLVIYSYLCFDWIYLTL